MVESFQDREPQKHSNAMGFHDEPPEHPDFNSEKRELLPSDYLTVGYMEAMAQRNRS